VNHWFTFVELDWFSLSTLSGKVNHSIRQQLIILSLSWERRPELFRYNNQYYTSSLMYYL